MQSAHERFVPRSRDAVRLIAQGNAVVGSYGISAGTVIDCTRELARELLAGGRFALALDRERLAPKAHPDIFGHPDSRPPRRIEPAADTVRLRSCSNALLGGHQLEPGTIIDATPQLAEILLGRRDFDEAKRAERLAPGDHPEVFDLSHIRPDDGKPASRPQSAVEAAIERQARTLRAP